LPKKTLSEPLLNSVIGEQPAFAFPGGLLDELVPTIGGFDGDKGVLVPELGLVKGEVYRKGAPELFAAHPINVPVGATVVPETLL
jgi:hypothetical protein